MITTEVDGELVRVASESTDGDAFTFLLSIQEALDLSCELANAAREAQKQREQIRYGGAK